MSGAKRPHSELTELLIAHGVYDAETRAGALLSEVKRGALGEGHTPRDVAEAARIAIDQLDAMSRTAADLTPGLILAALRGPRREPARPAHESCLGCEDGVVRMMAWRDGFVDAFACDCPAGRDRVPPLRAAIDVMASGSHADAHPVRLECWDFARRRTDDASLRHVVDDLFGDLRHLRPAPVRAVLGAIPSGEWPGGIVAMVEAEQARRDARVAAV